MAHHPENVGIIGLVGIVSETGPHTDAIHRIVMSVGWQM